MLSDAEIESELGARAENCGGQRSPGGLPSFLPGLHRRVLARCNGFTLHDGATRIFGIGRNDCLDLERWNDPEGWKFSWPTPLEGYVCFGQTARGDQYAYKADGTEEVFLLESIMLTPVLIASSFRQFAQSELLASLPVDELTQTVLNERGNIPFAANLVLAPPIAIGGAERIENVALIPCIDAMIAAGDIATAVTSLEAERAVEKLETWIDSRGRNRLRLHFLE